MWFVIGVVSEKVHCMFGGFESFQQHFVFVDVGQVYSNADRSEFQCIQCNIQMFQCVFKLVVVFLADHNWRNNGFFRRHSRACCCGWLRICTCCC